MGLILNFALFAVLIVTLKNPTTALKCAHPIRANQTIVFNTVTDSMKKLIVYRHNYYRKAIMAGKVPGQPKGINIKMLTWDNDLAKSAQEIANICFFKHKEIIDPRWKTKVGQNLYRTEQLTFDIKDVNWRRAVEYWFNEYEKYHYGRVINRDKTVQHYTQVIWGDTKYVGCGYVAYENHLPANESRNDIAEIYICNYGPPGNVRGHYPYIAVDY